MVLAAAGAHPGCIWAPARQKFLGRRCHRAPGCLAQRPGERAAREGSALLRLRVERDFYFCLLWFEPKKKLGRSQGTECILERDGFQFGDGKALGGTGLSALVWKSEPSLEAARILSSRFLRVEPTGLWASLQSQEEMAAGEERSVGGRRPGAEDLRSMEPFSRALLEARASPASMHLASGRVGGVV